MPALVGALWLAGCAGAASSEDRPAQGAEEVARQAARKRKQAWRERIDQEHADPEQAKRQLVAAEKALAAKRFGEARKELEEADRFANERIREEMRKVGERIDEAEAAVLAPPVVTLAEHGECREALRRVAELVEQRGGLLPLFIQERTAAVNLRCLADLAKADLPRARRIADLPLTRRALGKERYEKMRGELADAVVATLVQRLQGPFRARRWADVVKGLDDAVEQGEAGDEERRRVMGLVRDRVRQEIQAIAAQSMSAAFASGALGRVDQLIAAARWAEGSAEAAPDDIAKIRSELALWAACGAVRCRVSAPKKLWTLGNAQVLPTANPRGEPVKVIPSGKQVWELARGATWSLVAESDPGKLEDGISPRAEVAAGWVRSAGLKDVDTSRMVPPGEAIAGTRVWGPLRPPSTLLELGTAIAAQGGDVRVKRLADLEEVTVPRAELRFGAVDVGMKVEAYCQDPVHPIASLVEAIVPTDAEPLIKVVCLDEQGARTDLLRGIQLGALRTRPEWLPPEKTP
ncbi:MAG: hypothetical protein HY744_24925 [Deltaproteobacteria bacterium]|nr:hypothetical protein [Deltaproteobacteria bacterium]